MVWVGWGGLGLKVWYSSRTRASAMADGTQAGPPRLDPSGAAQRPPPSRYIRLTVLLAAPESKTLAGHIRALNVPGIPPGTGQGIVPGIVPGISRYRARYRARYRPVSCPVSCPVLRAHYF